MMQLVSQHQGVKVNNSLTCVLLKVPVLRNVNFIYVLCIYLREFLCTICMKEPSVARKGCQIL